MRVLRAGVWVSSYGLRQVGLFRTTTRCWAEAGMLRTVQRPVRWLGLPRTVQGQALVLIPAGQTAGQHGAAVAGDAERALLTSHNVDFLARPQAFERAADVVEGWAAESR